MADSTGRQPRFQDVIYQFNPCTRTSTKLWSRDANPHKNGRMQPAVNSHFPGDPPPNKVVRTGGITGTLPSQSLLPQPIPSSSSSSPLAPSTAAAPFPPPGQDLTPPPTPSPATPHAPRLTQLSQTRRENSTPWPAAVDEAPQREKKPLPSDDVLDALFVRLMNRMKLPPERVADLQGRSPEHKWSMILAQNEIQAGIACVFYIEQLVRHAQPELKAKHPKKRMLLNLQPLSTVLTDLEVDLRSNPNDSWVADFISTPNHGHVALIDLIKDLADSPQTVPRKNQKKFAVLERDSNCLYTALLCLKALMGHRKGFGAVLKYDPSLCILAYCLDSQSTEIKVLILKMMVTVLLAPGGHRKVMQGFDYFRAINKEKMRFQLLVASLRNQPAGPTHQPTDPAYQAAVVRFINTVVQVAKGPNAKVFHQQEFLGAGFNPDEMEKSLHAKSDERLVHELKEWRQSFINVQSYMDDLVVCRGRIRNLQEELEAIQTHLKEANLDRENLYEQTRNWMIQNEKQRQQISELRAAVSSLEEVRGERDALLEEKKKLVDAKQTYSSQASELSERVQTLMEENRALLNREILVQEQVESLNKYQTMVVVSPTDDNDDDSSQQQTAQPLPTADTSSIALETPPPAPPPAPPPPPETFFIPPPPPLPFGIPAPPPLPSSVQMQAKKPVVPNVPLPMLNWMPIKNPEHTIFKDMDDENIIETVDFSEFEQLFQVKKSKKQKLKRQDMIREKTAQKLSFIENRRSRNLTIAIRRIGLTAACTSEAVACTDLESLSSEHCELLLKFIPTKEELDKIEELKTQYEIFGEAEQFMYHLSKVERYEPRLECMAYMGNFDNMLTATQPQIDGVLSASLSILRSSRLKKVFEIILAFGNYMNSSRRGAAHGFKLESLAKMTDTKSHDRKQTLLSYMVHVVEKVFPNVLTFHEDLDIQHACSVSMAALIEDVSSLRQGLTILEAEMKEDPDNFVIFSFHRQAKKKIDNLNTTYSKMEDAYRELCLMFSENPKTTDPSDLFGIFANFIKDWKDSVSKNKLSKKRQFASTQDLLKKQREEEGVGHAPPTNTMAMLAAEIAAEAAVRSEKIRRKILEGVEAGEREVQSDGGAGGEGGGGERGGKRRKKRKKEKNIEGVDDKRTLTSKGSPQVSTHHSSHTATPTSGHAHTTTTDSSDYYANIVPTT